ncbi:MAG: AmmeMemoRadiSam system radical SAM enzyme [Clostridia bacterium]|nr:AmmeMemoRadiSam system radical SAM enzyme [Clostridia bacterium]
MSLSCDLCPHHCQLKEGQTGFCRARINCGDKIICANYGKITALALDPIEKKPLARFYPGSYILSTGSYGCNLRCSFCQNYRISMTDSAFAAMQITSQELIAKAVELKPQGNIGIAFTYNEPLVGYEFVRDCALLARSQALKTVLVTNAMLCRRPFEDLLPLIDALNIDLKSFNGIFYQKIAGDLATVKQNIKLAAQVCHLEVTTLIIPGENDSEEEMHKLADWLASVDPRIPLHISRFFPHYKMADQKPTPVETVYRLSQIAGQYLQYVYAGNC